MKNYVLPYLLAQASAAEQKHKDAMRADRGRKLPGLVALEKDAAGAWANKYIGDLDNVQKTCTDADVVTADGLVKAAKVKVDKFAADALIASPKSKTILVADAQAKLVLSNAAVKAAQDQSTLITALKNDNEKQNTEYAKKNSWVVAYRAMIAAKAESDAAVIAETAAKKAVTDAKKIFDELTISKAEADSHATAEKTLYDASLLLKVNKKKEWDCYALSISHKATAAANVSASPLDTTQTCKLDAGGSTALEMTVQVGNCRREAYTDEIGRAAGAGAVNPAPTNIYFDKFDADLRKTTNALAAMTTDTACKAACIADTRCVAAEVTAAALTTPIVQAAGCVLYYKDPEWKYKGDTQAGVKCFLRANKDGLQKIYDDAWTAYKTTQAALIWAKQNNDVQLRAIASFRVKVETAGEDIDWVRVAHIPSSLRGLKEEAGAGPVAARADIFSGAVSGATKSQWGVFGVTLADITATRDATAWSTKYADDTKKLRFETVGATTYGNTYTGNEVEDYLQYGWDNANKKHTWWSASDMVPFGLTPQATAGRIITKGAGDGAWTKIAGVNGGLNIYTQVLKGSGTGYNLRQTAKAIVDTSNTPKAEYTTYNNARVALIAKYKEINDDYKLFALYADKNVYVQMATGGGANFSCVTTPITETANAAATNGDCKTACSAKGRWVGSSDTKFKILDPDYTLGVANTNVCFGYSFTTAGTVCKLISKALPTASSAAAGDCQIRKGSVMSNASSNGGWTKFLKNVTLIANTSILTNTTPDGDNKQVTFDTAAATYRNWYYCQQAGTCDGTNSSTGKAAKAEHKVNMAYYYLKALNKVLTKQTDLYSEGAITCTGTPGNCTLLEKGGTVLDIFTKATSEVGTKKGTFDTASGLLLAMRALEGTAAQAWKGYEKTVEIDLKEKKNQDYIKAELVKELTRWTATLGTDATTANSLYKAEAEATAAKTTKGLVVTTPVTGTVNQEGIAKGLWTDATVEANKTRDLLATELDAVMKLRVAAATDQTDLATAISNWDGVMLLKKAEVDKLATEEKARLVAIMKCQGKQYDTFYAELQKRLTARKKKLADIEALLDAQITGAPKKGAAGWRCEKAISNGTFRPTRNEKTCATGLCCGAAKYTAADNKNLVITVETCQTAAAKTYSYQPPRQPLAIAMPASKGVPWACITGANKLASAATALAAAVYLMA